MHSNVGPVRGLAGGLLLFSWVIFVAASPVSLHAQAVETVPLIDGLVGAGLTVQYEPILNELFIQRGLRFISLSPDLGLGMVNGQLSFALAGLNRSAGGELRVSTDGLEALLSYFETSGTGTGRKIGAILIDPGHGGRDPGTIGRFTVDGKTVTLQEKDIVLRVALGLAQALRQRFPDKNIVLTRTTDVYLTLEERTNLANGIQLGENEDIVYLSIHVNAALNPNARGFEVWYLPPEYRRELLTEEEKAASAESVRNILNDIKEEEVSVQSIILAQSISRNLEQAVGSLTENRGLFEEEWYVVRNARMPSVLAELGFVTNREEFNLLGSTDYLNKLATGIYNGILAFIENFESIQ